MGVEATTTDAVLAATMVSLTQSLERLKMIAERSKSTDATLARIARRQASWEPTEPVVQQGMERCRDSLARQMEVTAQAVARISGVKASTLTSSSAIHHDIPYVSPTKTSTLGLSPKIDDVGIQIPAAVVESTPAVAASATTAPLLLTDQVVPVGASHVESNLAVFMPTRCLTVGLGVDAVMQLSAFTREATPCASLTAVVLDGELKHGAGPFPKEDYDNVMTCIGGISIFWELDSGSAENFGGRPSHDIASGTELVDNVLTYVGSLPLFQEPDMDSDMILEKSVDKAEDAMILIWVPLSQRNKVFDVTPLSEQTAFGPVKSGTGGPHGVFHSAPPWGNNGFHPVNFAAKADHLWLTKIPPWQRSAFSPWLGNNTQVIPIQQEGIYHSTCPIESRRAISRKRPWDPGDVAIYECGVFIPSSAQFIQNLLKNTSPDMRQLILVPLSAEGVHDILMCFLLAAMEGSKTWAGQRTKPLNFNEKLQVEQLLCYDVEEVPDNAETTCSFNTLLSGYLTKAVICLQRKTASLMNYVHEHQEIVFQLVGLIGITSIRASLIHLIGADKTNYSHHVDTMHWLKNTEVLGRIRDKFSSSYSPEVHAIVVEILCVVTQCAPPSLAAKICGPRFVGRLFCHALEGIRPKSVPVHLLSRCISSLDPKILASPSYQAFRSKVILGALVTASPETVNGMLASLGNLLNLSDTSAAENGLPMIYGCLRSPLKKHPPKILEFISVLLIIGSETADKELISQSAIKRSTDLFFQEEPVHQIQQEACSRCYFHMQLRLFGFDIHQLCNMTPHDGIPWDPGGIHGSKILAIAWGQAMFYRGGSVTPGVHHGLGLACWWLYMGLGQLVNSWSRKDKGDERDRRGIEQKTEPKSELLSPFVSPVPDFSGGRSPQAVYSSGGRSPQAALSSSSRSGDLRQQRGVTPRRTSPAPLSRSSLLAPIASRVSGWLIWMAAL